MTATPYVDESAQAEAVVLRLRRHGRYLVLPVLLLIAVAGAGGFWVGALPEAWMNIVAAAGAAMVAIVLGIGPVLGWLAGRTIVTNRRVIVRRGLFVQHRSEMPLGRARDVRSRRTIVQRVFGSGDIELVGGVDGSMTLRDLPGHERVADALRELIEQSFVLGATGAFGVGSGIGTGGAAAGFGGAFDASAGQVAGRATPAWPAPGSPMPAEPFPGMPPNGETRPIATGR